MVGTISAGMILLLCASSADGQQPAPATGAIARTADERGSGTARAEGASKTE